MAIHQGLLTNRHKQKLQTKLNTTKEMCENVVQPGLEPGSADITDKRG